MADASSTRDENVAPDKLNRMLRRSWETVYQLTPDGETYTSPQCLNGTPVQKITEKCDYWNFGWNSLDVYLAQEKGEEESKEEAYRRHKLDSSKGNWHILKTHTDNISKHRRIRDIFGPDSAYHPNQLVSKHHLPYDGLCQKELMYRMACKVADLRILRDKGELAMDPWDFFRWRISLKLQSCLDFSAQSGRDFVKTLVYKLCEDSGPYSTSKKYEDPLLRQAIIRSAGYQNRAASFGKIGEQKKNEHKKTANGSKVRPRIKVEPPLSLSNPEKAIARIKRRQKKEMQLPTYQGVNAYRARQAAKQISQNSGSEP
ncbi:acyl thioesterase ii [Fusarium heterosporum]|uniref:Acyl thioesterase ii n=1 Tax=Fusarium heterosporum TaxID=42747 RepID=A0A8H5WV75_FUSHE|nr:acyl thioesterase ii [Fusarium heterosporum]